MMNAINPDYYKNTPLPFECIDLTEQYSFSVGNMLKYMFRLYGKDTPLQNIQKAQWYAKRALHNKEPFTPIPEIIAKKPHRNASEMLYALEMADWQGVEEFWRTMNDMIENHENPEQALTVINSIMEQMD